VNAFTLQYAWLKRSFHDVDLTIQVKNVTDWLENEQPKQERHSMQCGGGIQWVKRWVEKYLPGVPVTISLGSFKVL
jgi:hypothetical protein